MAVLVATFVGAEAKVAPHPLGGAPLFVEVQGLEDLIEKYTATACTLRPVTNTFEVRVTDKEICISSVQHMLGYQQFAPAAGVMPMNLKVDGQDAVRFDLKRASRLEKVGQCFVGDPNFTELWEGTFEACQPNRLVTPRTRTVALHGMTTSMFGGDGPEWVSWKLKPAAGAAAGAQPPSPVASGSYDEAVRQLASGSYGDALANLNAYLAAHPKQSNGYVARGNALAGLRRFSEAQTDYAYALTLQPSSAMALYGSAEALRGLNRLDEARGYYQRFLDSASSEATPALKGQVAKRLASLK